MNKKPYLVSVLCLSLFASTVMFNSASADDSKLYIGLGYGTASVKADEDGECELLNLVGANCNGLTTDSSSSATKFFLGTKFNENFGLEVGYVNFGTVKSNAHNGADTFDFDVNGFTVGLVGFIPVSDSFRVLGRLGMISWKSTAKVHFAFAGDVTADTTGSDVLYGIGVEWDIAKSFSVRAELEKYQVGVTNAGAGEFSVRGLSGVVRF